MEISKFAANVAPSATLAAGAKAKELAAQGITVYDFSLGEPDFNTPEHICEAARKAIAEGKTRYTPASGVPALKTAVADYHREWHQIDYKPEQVCVSSGAKHAIYTALCAVLNPGDEVIIPAPYWVSYSDLVIMTGAVPVVVPTTAESGFKITPEQLVANCTAKSKLLMLNSPSNPTGAAYTKAELEKIADVVLEKNLIVLSDEIYDRLIYGDFQFTAFAALSPEIKERTLTINGVSKTYAMTGWRIGWTAGPANIIKAMGNIQSQQTSNPCSVSQFAAIAALKGDQTCVAKMKEQFAKRRDYVCDRLAKMDGISIVPPDGAFYAFFDVSSYFGKTFGETTVKDSTEFCLASLMQAHVNVVMGSAFGSEGFARMSYATSMEELGKGLDTFEAWLKTAK